MTTGVWNDINATMMSTIVWKYINDTKTSTSVWNYINDTTMSTEGDISVEEYLEYKVAVLINKYYLYILLILGLFGSISTLVTLTTMRPFLASAIFMCVLAVVDGTALIWKMLYLQITLSGIQIGDFMCGFFYTFGSWTQQYSNWILVAMTTERFIAIWFPLKVSKLCSKTRTIVESIVIAILIFGLNLHFVWTFQEISDPVLKHSCAAKREYTSFINRIWYWIDGTSYSLSPIVIIAFLNGMIIHGIRKARKKHRDLTNIRIDGMKERSRQERQITIMLITLCVVFCILTLPNCIFFVLKDTWNWNQSNYQIALYSLLYQIVFVLSDFHQSVNFYLYCLTGKKFRNQFKTVVMCRRGQSNRKWQSKYTDHTISTIRNRSFSAWKGSESVCEMKSTENNTDATNFTISSSL
ncbi:hypothetical protein ACJMK2_022457 [Sinanodonta woodiana]|uniref:G-protein coupled receptors family 1 profile domain-containing protein n=1 Tax=Sinanodonta woodiana TaxID=1069815 RepID=A0ABD3TL99_SINWO